MIKKTARVVIMGAALLFLSLGVTNHSEADDSYKRLVVTPYFAVGGISIDGHISDAEKDLWLLLRNKDEVRLVRLTQRRNMAARMYGLLGLRYLNSQQYKQNARSLSASLSTSHSKVDTMSGCIRDETDVSILAKHIDSGIYNDYLKYDMKRRHR